MILDAIADWISAISPEKLELKADGERPSLIIGWLPGDERKLARLQIMLEDDFILCRLQGIHLKYRTSSWHRIWLADPKCFDRLAVLIEKSAEHMVINPVLPGQYVPSE